MLFENTFYLSQQLGVVLKQKGLKICLAESCTAGGITQEITAVPGSSDWLDCGFVVYSDDSKMKMLGISRELLQTYGAVSEEVAKAMAEGGLKNSQADIS